MMIQVLESQAPTAGDAEESWSFGFGWPSPGYGRQLGCEPVNGRSPSFFMPVSLSLPVSVFIVILPFK